jgi:hypothetical protein
MLCVAAGLMLTASAVQAQDADFTLTNATGYALREVYVSPSKQESWGADRLGSTVLEDGKSKLFKFPKSQSACMQDLKVVYDDDGSSAKWEGINLCEIDKVRIRYNRSTDTTSATFE